MARDPYFSDRGRTDALGRGGFAIVASNTTDMDPLPKAVIVGSIAAGSTLQILPMENPDGAWLTFSGVAVGFVPPFRVRRIGTATNCTVFAVTG